MCMISLYILAILCCHAIDSQILVFKPNIYIYFLKEDFIRKSTKTTLLTRKYTYMYITPPVAYTDTIQNEVFTVVKKHLSNGQLSRKVVQLIYVGCPRLMQLY